MTFIFKIFRSGFAVFLSYVFTSCLTPMPQNEIPPLTECAHGNLDIIEKNLALLGYKISHASKNTVSTDFTQLPHRGIWQRVSAVKTTAGKIKLVFTQRRGTPKFSSEAHFNHFQDPTHHMHSNHRVIHQYDSIPDEFPAKFYLQRKTDYIEQQRRICARGNGQ